MTRKRILTVALTVAVPILIAAWWLGSPLFLDKTVTETFPLSANAAIPAGMTQKDAEWAMVEAALVDDAPMDEAMPADMEPEVIRRGEFRDADDFHKGSGTATIYRLDDGSHLLRFEDFRVTNGPDLRVLLSPAPDVLSRDALEEVGYVELDKLKGNVGSQNYPISADVEVGDQMTVIIYCKPFHVLFGVAVLTDVDA